MGRVVLIERHEKPDIYAVIKEIFPGFLTLQFPIMRYGTDDYRPAFESDGEISQWVMIPAADVKGVVSAAQKMVGIWTKLSSK